MSLISKLINTNKYNTMVMPTKQNTSERFLYYSMDVEYPNELKPHYPVRYLETPRK